MLQLSLSLLVITAVFGSALAALHLRTGKLASPKWPLGALHGLLGAVGFISLLPVLEVPPRGAAMGVASFGRIAAVLLAVALLAGFGLLVARLRYRRVPGLLIGIHATLAVGGVVILAAYTLMG